MRRCKMGDESGNNDLAMRIDKVTANCAKGHLSDDSHRDESTLVQDRTERLPREVSAEVQCT